MIKGKEEIILHLSDLHFSSKYRDPTQASQKLLMENLISSIYAIESQWRPNIICVSGDIVDKSDVAGFDPALEWFQQLSKRLGISIDRFLLCPGNHDGVRDIQINPLIVPSSNENQAVLHATNSFLYARPV